MSARICPWMGVAIAWLGVNGCHDSVQRLNAPPQGPNERPHALQPDLTYMVDNAMLHDMSVADIHFVPHTVELSSLGVRRLIRYSELLSSYGGTLHYETDEPDEEIVAGRIEKVKAFLAAAGVDVQKVQVEAGMSGGRGMPADRSLDALERESQCQKEAAGSGTSGKTGTSSYSQ